jgi:hypothetical protein
MKLKFAIRATCTSAYALIRPSIRDAKRVSWISRILPHSYLTAMERKFQVGR